MEGVSARRGVLLCAALAAACSRSGGLSPHATTDADAGGDATVDGADTAGNAFVDGSDTGRDAIVDGTDAGGDAVFDGASSIASNGVPIPPLDLSRTCPHLVQIASCTDTCPRVTCDCGGTTQTFNQGCIAHECIASVSCAATCALGDQVLVAVDNCYGTLTCRSAAECQPAGLKCIMAPGDPIGECASGQAAAKCFTDADCKSGSCVVMSASIRQCQDGHAGAPCNRDANCAAPQRCALPAGSFLGKCTSGTLNTACVTKADCKAPFDCMSVGGIQICSSGEAGAACATAKDCNLPFCVRGTCSNGAPGDECQQDADCQMHCTRNGAAGVCTNGEMGQACPCDGPCDCAAGLHCTAGNVSNGVGPAGSGAGTCVAAPGPDGSFCVLDADCQSGMCSSALSGCTEGKEHEPCRDASQCLAGLHCVVLFGAVGTCFGGHAGDPCTQPTECLSGVCSPTPAPSPTACAFSPGTVTPCDQGGSCILGQCYQQRCGGAADAGAPP
jgi:hypothetical protein